MSFAPPAEAVPPSPFDTVVFSGGGCRCFWQAGFWSEAAPRLDLAPEVIGAVSAGSAMACALMAGRMEAALEVFKDAARSNRANRYPGNYWSGKPVFPQEELYRQTIRAATDETSLAQLHAGPDVRILLGRPPEWAGRVGTLALGTVAMYAKRWLERDLHGPWGMRAGFRAETVSIRECQSTDELEDLIMQSSCIPPAIPLYWRSGRPVVDGGIVDGVPVDVVPEARSMLVLLSSHRPPQAIPRVAGRVYVAPSQEVPIDKWDYTSPERVQATYDLGRRDGETFARAFGHMTRSRSPLAARSKERTAAA